MTTVLAGPDTARAYRTLDKIIADPKSWYQRSWLTVTECGTAGCFAGLTCILAGDQVRFSRGCDDFPYIADADGAPVAISTRAAELLGIGEDQQEHLFRWDNTLDDLVRLVGEIFGPRDV